MKRMISVMAVVGIGILGLAGCGGPARTGADYVEQADFKAGKKAFEEKKYDDAIRLLSRFVEKYPTNIYADRGHLLMGQAAENTEKYELAIQAYSEVIDSPEAPFDFKNVAYLGRGNSYFETDQFEKALDDYQTIESDYLNSPNIDPAEIITKIGLTYKMLNDTARADRYFVKVLDDYTKTDYVKIAAANHSKLGALDPSGNGRFTVIAGVYLSKEKADAIAVKVKGLGFVKTTVKQAPTGEFMVLVDQFISPREAQTVVDKIQDAGVEECTLKPEL